MFPIIKNFLLYFTNWSTYSLNKENGGFVTTMSDCFNSSIDSLLRKSPSPKRGFIPISSASGILLPFKSPLYSRNTAFSVFSSKNKSV